MAQVFNHVKNVNLAVRISASLMDGFSNTKPTVPNRLFTTSDGIAFTKSLLPTALDRTACSKRNCHRPLSFDSNFSYGCARPKWASAWLPPGGQWDSIDSFGWGEERNERVHILTHNERAYHSSCVILDIQMTQDLIKIVLKGLQKWNFVARPELFERN